MVLESNSNLYQRPLYKAKGQDWNLIYGDCVNIHNKLSIDKTAICSFLSVGQFSANRTLFNEIKRLPWMSKPLSDGGYLELDLPKHDFKTGSDKLLSDLLFEKLCNEAREVIKTNDNIYILLTGGLDSRVIAGVYSYLYNNGEIKRKPKCLTWGIENSRDVYYAKIMAEKLNFEWQHVPLGPETVLENIEKCGEYLGMLHSPEMLHSMLWFKNLPSDAMVVAGSFGDSIGRGEFSSLHLLQLEHKKPKNTYDLLTSGVFDTASETLKLDIDKVHRRGGENTLKYMQCEYWMQGYRMRNGLCHALSVINRFANVYQMFTMPEVFSFIWSLHPSRRDDDIYITLLKNHFPKLAEVPWARNNKAIKGDFKEKELKAHYHDYTKWSSGILYNDIKKKIDPDWFAEKGIFNADSIIQMNDLVKKSEERVGRLNDIWLWLAGFRVYIDQLESQGKVIDFKASISSSNNLGLKKEFFNPKDNMVLIASKSERLNEGLKKIRKMYRDFNLKIKKKEMLKKYPPKFYE